MDFKFSDLLNMSNQEAIVILADEYKKTGDFPTLRNLNLFLSDTDQWQFVKDNCKFIIQKSEFTSDGDFVTIGMADWFMGNESSAIDFWKQACDAKYTDSVGAIDGPLVLWYAGRRLGDKNLVKESLKKLKRFWKVTDYRKIVKWPGTIAIAGFLLAEVPAGIFLKEWKWNPEPLEHRRLCRVNFWVGMTLEGRSTDEAIKNFEAAFCSNKIAILEYEYLLAKWEHSRLTEN